MPPKGGKWKPSTPSGSRFGNDMETRSIYMGRDGNKTETRGGGTGNKRPRFSSAHSSSRFQKKGVEL